MDDKEGQNKYYKEMRALTDRLRPWYDIDKIKSWGVFVWSKSEGNPYGGANVFDIYKDEICYFVEGHVIPDEAWPIIREIQEKLIQ